MNEGGKYSFDNQEAKPFPMEKPAKPHLYQGNTQVMQLTAPSGATIHLSINRRMHDRSKGGRKFSHDVGQFPDKGSADSKRQNCFGNK
jgi:hypothetical protein